MTKPKWLTEPLGLTGEALEVWRKYAPGLRRDGFLRGDGGFERLRVLCRLMAIISRASDDIEERGVVLRSKSGATKANPAVPILMAAQKEAKPLMIEFNLWGRD